MEAAAAAARFFAEQEGEAGGLSCGRRGGRGGAAYKSAPRWALSGVSTPHKRPRTTDSQQTTCDATCKASLFRMGTKITYAVLERR
eukprot:363066-Chlamydomonas_euryale.AAC.17